MRMHHYLIKVVDLSLVVVLLYHAGYGLASVINDYLRSRALRIGLAALVFLVMAFFAVLGIQLIVIV
jgi:succinate dehydrogenase hydrophobic anchor subunit